MKEFTLGFCFNMLYGNLSTDQNQFSCHWKQGLLGTADIQREEPQQACGAYRVN
jgi:hypothetical protein